MSHLQSSWTLRLVTLLLIFVAIHPTISHAQTSDVPAGFATGPIWLSRSHAVAGETVNILSVLYNSSDISISGDAIIYVDDSSIGTKSFTLASGETQIVSLPWIAEEGGHSISARIEKVLDGNTTASSMLNKQTGKVTVSIKAKASLPPTATVQVLNAVTSAIETGVASSAPIILRAMHSVFNTTESLRADAKAALERHLAESQAEDATAKQPKKMLTGSEQQSAATTIKSADTGTTIRNALRYAASAGLFVVSSQTMYYISLALILLLLIQILRVSLRDRRRRRRDFSVD
jgi:hypothetical protein